MPLAELKSQFDRDHIYKEVPADQSHEEEYFFEAMLPIDEQVINRLPQPRRTFEKIHEIAMNMLRQGLLNPIKIGRFTEITAAQHLDLINKRWDTEITLDDLNWVEEGDERVAYILIDGERRFRGMLMIKEIIKHMQEEENPKVGELIKSFNKRFPNNHTRVHLYPNITPEKAFNIQESANTSVSVKPAEQAQSLDNLFWLYLQSDPKLTLSEFAEMVGRSVDTIGDARLFMSLPDKVIEMVISGGIKYGMALELGRFRNRVAEHNKRVQAFNKWLEEQKGEGKELEKEPMVEIELTTEDLVRHAKDSVQSQEKLPQFRNRLQKEFEKLTPDKKEIAQLDLMSISQEVMRDAMKEVTSAEVQTRQFVNDFFAIIRHWAIVLKLTNKGLLPIDESPLVNREASEFVLKSLEFMRQALPHLRYLKYRERAETIILLDTLQPVLSEHVATLPKQPSLLNSFSQDLFYAASS